MNRKSDKGGDWSPSGADHPSDSLRREARDWLVLLASGEMRADDRARLKQWLGASPAHREAFERENAVWRNLAHVRDELTPAAPRAYVRDAVGAGRMAAGRARREPGRLRTATLAAAAIAASLLVVALSNEALLWLTADYRTASGEQTKVTLADGSVAHLNTDSAISIDYSETRRRIDLLRGEAHFTVARNAARPFVVGSHGGTARAVGTAFAVRDDSGSVTVTVTSGTVAVAPEQEERADSAGPRPVELSANEQVVYREGGAATGVREVDANSILGWREGRIVIDHMPFAEAISELDRYMPGRILIASANDTSAPVSGVFSQDRLDSALRVLAATQGMSLQHITPYLILLY